MNGEAPISEGQKKLLAEKLYGRDGELDVKWLNGLSKREASNVLYHDFGMGYPEPEVPADLLEQLHLADSEPAKRTKPWEGWVDYALKLPREVAAEIDAEHRGAKAGVPKGVITGQLVMAARSK